MENLGLVTYRETLLLADPEQVDARRAARRGRDGRARARAHVVRRPRDDALVERHLAERGLRDLHVLPLRRRDAAGLARVGLVRAEPGERVRGRRAREHAHDRVPRARRPTTRAACSTRSRTRRAARSCGCSSSGSARTGSATGSAATCAPTRTANTETHDLWDALEAETGEPVRRVMDAWIFQAGYPAITVAPRRRRAPCSRQHRFLPSAPDDTTTWPVPLIVRQVHAGRRAGRTACSSRPTGSRLPIAADDAVVVGNAGGASFVRVFYDDELRERLVARRRASSDARRAPGPRGRRVGAAVAGQASAVVVHRPGAGLRRRGRPGRLEGDHRAGSGGATGSSTGAPRDRFRDMVRDLVRPALDRLGWDAAARATPTWTASCAAT